MPKAAESIEIADVDNRCEELFSDSNERCWNLAVKEVKMGGRRKRICLAHYESWLTNLAEVNKILEQKKGG